MLRGVSALQILFWSVRKIGNQPCSIVSADHLHPALLEQLPVAGFRQIPLQDASVWLNDALIEPQRASAFQHQLLAECEWHQPVIRMGSRKIHSPRLAAWYGERGAIYTYSGLQNEPRPWTSALAAIRSLIVQTLGIDFNSVLVNCYRSGQDSMGWHRDNEPELGPHPIIVSVSLGETRKFLMQHVKNRQARWETMLQHGSALVMLASTQRWWKHAVPKTKVYNGVRLNLTFRQILR